jgi:hypothetical protein
MVMQKQSTPWIPDENPALSGPDYVALVIEWDEIDDQVTQVNQRIRRAPRALFQVAGAALAAVTALGLVGWGIHHLRA